MVKLKAVICCDSEDCTVEKDTFVFSDSDGVVRAGSPPPGMQLLYRLPTRLFPSIRKVFCDDCAQKMLALEGRDSWRPVL